MSALSRRHALMLLATAGVSTVTRSAGAIEPAKTIKEVWPELQAGNFEHAVQRLQLYVTEWPLDREVRSNLAIMQFAAELFEKSAENLRWVVRLERAIVHGSGLRFDMDYIEAWYHVAQLRAGHSPDTPSPPYPYSLLTVLTGAQEVRSFAAKATEAYFAYLDHLEQMMGESTGSSGSVTATVRMNVQRPDRDAVELSYLCIGQFFLAEQRIGLGDRTSGKDLLAQALDSKAEGAVEYHIAKAELTRLGSVQ